MACGQPGLRPSVTIGFVIKFKWWFPLTPLVNIPVFFNRFPHAPADVQVLFVAAILIICGILFGIVQPWKP